MTIERPTTSSICWRGNNELTHLRAKFRQAVIASAMVAACHILALLGERTLSFPQLIQLVEISLGCYVQLYDARLTHKNGWPRNGQFRPALNMDTLISLSIILSLGVSFFNLAVLQIDQARTYFVSGSFLTTVIIGGRYLDAFLKRRGANNLANLYRLQVETADVETSAGEVYSPLCLRRAVADMRCIGPKSERVDSRGRDHCGTWIRNSMRLLRGPGNLDGG